MPRNRRAVAGKGRRLCAVLTLAVIPVAASLLVACSPGCGTYVDYTVPPVQEVLAGADGVVRARVVSFPTVDEYVVEAELEVSEVIADNGGLSAEQVGAASVTVGAYDDPCERRSGLRLTEGEALLVVLKWIGPDNEGWAAPWHAFPVLMEEPDGSVTFLDTGYKLNGRIDQILGEATIAGLVAAVRNAGV